MKQPPFRSIAYSIPALCLFAFEGMTQSYGHVRIGELEWMRENLNVAGFRNGDPIPEARTMEECRKAFESKQPAWCYYGNDSANGARYGRLYNWWAVMDPRGLAPTGWHLPNDEEWTILTTRMGGDRKAAMQMKSTVGWSDTKKRDANGTNESGFTALPGGNRNPYFLDFFSIGTSTYWWSTTEANEDYGWGRGILDQADRLKRSRICKCVMASIRCVKDRSP